MNSSSNTPQETAGTSIEVEGAVDAYLKKEMRRYTKVAAFTLSAICAAGGFLFKVMIENQLSELNRAREDISREIGRVEEKARRVDDVLDSIRETESKVREVAPKVEEHEARLSADRKTIDETLRSIKTEHDEGSRHVASLKKRAEDAQFITLKLEERVRQLEDNVQKTLQAMQRKAGEISSAAQAVESQMALQEKQRREQIETRRATLLRTDGLPGSAHRVVYSKDPKGVSVYLTPTNHVSSDAVGAVKFSESDIGQFVRLDVPEQSNDGTPQARVRFTGWVHSSKVEGADAHVVQDNPAQLLLSPAEGAALHQDPASGSPVLLDFKAGKSIPAIATGETQSEWLRVVIDAWMPVRFDKSFTKLLIAPAKPSGG